MRTIKKEIKDLLASLRVPIIEATTLERPLTLEFTNLIYEMVIVLLPRDLGKLKVDIRPPNPMTENYFMVKMRSLSKKRKKPDGPSSFFTHEKGKKVMTHTLKSLKSMLMY